MGRKEGTGERPLSLLLRVLALFFFFVVFFIFLSPFQTITSARLVVSVAGCAVNGSATECEILDGRL